MSPTVDPDLDLGLPLTPRETEVALAVSRGLQRKEIAAELGISADTVAKHLASAFRKLDVHASIDLLIAMGLVAKLSDEQAGVLLDVAGLAVRLATIRTDIEAAEARLAALQAGATS